MAREYFHAYHSYLETIEPLNDAERGRLFTACLIYSKTGEVPELRGNERFVFFGLKGQIDRDAKQYDDKCRINRANASRGGQANASERLRTVPNAPQGKGKGKGKGEGEYITPLPPTGGEKALRAEFETLWARYPRKLGKDKALKAYIKSRKSGVEFEAVSGGLEAYLAMIKTERTEMQYVKHGSTWFGGHGWDDDFTPAPAALKPNATVTTNEDSEFAKRAVAKMFGGR